MFKTLIIALLPVLAAQVAYADTTLASMQSAAPSHAQVLASCEGPGALQRNVEPCASFWTRVQSGMIDCMGSSKMTMPAYRARYLICSGQARESYLAGGQ